VKFTLAIYRARTTLVTLMLTTLISAVILSLLLLKHLTPIAVIAEMVILEITAKSPLHATEELVPVVEMFITLLSMELLTTTKDFVNTF